MKTTKEKSLNHNILGLGFRPTTVCTRPATARIFNHTLLTKSVLIVADFASPQAGETGALGCLFYNCGKDECLLHPSIERKKIKLLKTLGLRQ
jgi:hypothetical protein